MSAGLALETIRRYPDIKNKIKVILKANPGYEMIRNKNNYYNMIFLLTKQNYYDKPTIDSMNSALRTLKHFCNLEDLHDLHFPKIGCGLDKLNWEDEVKPLIKTHFDNSNVKLIFHKMLYSEMLIIFFSIFIFIIVYVSLFFNAKIQIDINT